MRRWSAALAFVCAVVGCTSHETLELASPEDGVAREGSLRKRPDADDDVRPPPVEDDDEPSPDPEPDPVWELGPQDVMVQLAYEPTFAAVLARNPFHSDGRVPPFTLYADGTIIYRARGRSGVWVTRDPRRLAERTVAHLLALGFEEVASHESSCRPTPEGKSCLSDASIVILRVRVDGELQERRNYAGIALAKEAELHAMYDRIDLLSRPAPFGERPYVPQRATLWVEESTPEQAEIHGALPWPLPAERLPPPDAEDTTKLHLEGEALSRTLDTIGEETMSHHYFRDGDRVVVAVLVPWLPGETHPDAPAD